MELLGGLAGIAAVAIGALVIGDAVLSIAGVIGTAGWAGLVVLAFPALMLGGYWWEEGRFR